MARKRRLVAGGALLAGALPLAASVGAPFSVRVIDDPGPAASCSDPTRLPNQVPDVNRMPQAEVAIDVAEDGRIAAAAKDFRYSPPTSTRYNDRVWNGLYLSSDGRTWRNLSFDDGDPNHGLRTVTRDDLGQAAGTEVLLDLETDPVVAFDGEGNLYTSALALGTGAGGPTAVVLARRDRDGRLDAGGLRFFGTEADARLANDKNWLAVDRAAPADRAVVAQTWRLFVDGTGASATNGGFIAVSADGARSFGPSLRLPVAERDAAASQFYQPVIGPAPGDRRATLYVFFTVGEDAGPGLEMHLLRADIADARGDTGALSARLAQPDGWTSLPRRITGLSGFGRNGWEGDFRVASYFHPSVDPETGELFVSFHAVSRAGEAPRAFVARSGDGGATWSAPLAVDPAGSGAQLLPAVAARGGVASLVWYDTRHDPTYSPGGVIRGIDVYYAEVDAELRPRRLLRLTPETQVVAPLFTRSRGVAASAARPARRPHDFEAGELLPRDAAHAAATGACEAERYGFLGDYIGLAVDAGAAHAAWADLRDRTLAPDVCAGHTCEGNRNANIWYAYVPR
jgi:hypothetical protein